MWVCRSRRASAITAVFIVSALCMALAPAIVFRFSRFLYRWAICTTPLHSTSLQSWRVESSLESVVVIRNVYGTFNFIWIITICFRRLAEKFSHSRSLLFPTLIFYLSSPLSLSRSLSLALCLSCSICGAFAGTMSHEVGVGLLSGVPGCSCSFASPSPFRNVIANFRQM